MKYTLPDLSELLWQHQHQKYQLGQRHTFLFLCSTLWNQSTWNDKINENANKTLPYIREEKSIPSSCSFSTALLTRGVISVESELFFSILSQLWNWKQKLAEIAQMTIVLTTQLRQRYSPYQPWQSKRTGHEDSDAIYRSTVRQDNLRIEPFNFFIQFKLLKLENNWLDMRKCVIMVINSIKNPSNFFEI